MRVDPIFYKKLHDFLDTAICWAEQMKSHLSKWRAVMIAAYQDYQASEEWRGKREKCLRENNYKCKLCGAKATIAHHTTYRNWALGDEELRDLIAICKRCHTKLHKEMDDKVPFFAERKAKFLYTTLEELRRSLEKIDQQFGGHNTGGNRVKP